MSYTNIDIHPMVYFRTLPYTHQKILADSVTKYKILPEMIVNKMVVKGLINANNDVIKHLVDAGYHIMLLCDIIKKRKHKKKLQKATVQKTKDSLENILKQLDVDINNLRYTSELNDYIKQLASDGNTLIIGNVLKNGNTLELSDGSRPDTIIKVITNRISGTVKVEKVISR